MQIWVDADACPKVIKEILFRAAERVGVLLVFVANQPLRIPKSPYISTILVPEGFDVADDQIIERVQPEDLVITGDIPLAAAIVKKGAFALNPRGKFYDKNNIGEALTMRNFMDEIRGSGIDTKGPSPFKPSNREAFANQLHRFLTQHKQKL